MLTNADRFSTGQVFFNEGAVTVEVFDFDQRKTFSVRCDRFTEPEDVSDTIAAERLCLEKFLRCFEDLRGGDFGFAFDGAISDPIVKLTNEEDDPTDIINYQPPASLGVDVVVKTVFIKDLIERDRLSLRVDRVQYKEGLAASPDDRQKTWAFKYFYKIIGHARAWLEIDRWSQLPRDHAHILPIDAVVLDHEGGGVVGFTTPFRSRGTLADLHKTQDAFCLKWLQQLLLVLDDLNYNYGLMHGDVAPRNLVINDEDDLQIMDFDAAFNIESQGIPRDDAQGVVYTLYEIVTLDHKYRKQTAYKKDARTMLAEMRWEKHPDVQLDASLDIMKETVLTWLNGRASVPYVEKSSWIKYTQPVWPLAPIDCFDHNGNEIRIMMPSPAIQRKSLIKSKRPFYNWERPASLPGVLGSEDLIRSILSQYELPKDLNRMSTEEGVEDKSFIA